MNGGYILSQTPGGYDTQKRFPAQYADYPRGVEFFDVYSPTVKTLYSQVFWKGLDPVELPADIVKRFDGKGMAVVGFELDQVRRTPDGDVPVPISVTYNHHFESNMIGKHAALERVKLHGPDDPRLKDMQSCGHSAARGQEAWVARDLGTSRSGLPTKQAFGAANGGEVRKSFHGYAPGFAQVIDSPTKVQITPMQIDTWNRDEMNVSHPTRFVAGPLPRNSLAPPGAEYSGLLECPVTTRIRKDVAGSYEAQNHGSCESAIQTASECFAAAKKALGVSGANFTFSSGSDGAKPPGCSAGTSSADDAQLIHVLFNSAAEGAACGAGATRLLGSTSSLVQLTLSMDTTTHIVTINITGPAGVWLGVGFNATSMGDEPWAVIVDADGDVTERKLQDQSPGKQLQTSVTVVSSQQVEGQRMVVLTRPFQGATADHFTFDPAAKTQLNFINAVGGSPHLSYHKEKAPSSIALLPPSTVPGACICANEPAPFGSAKGTLTYVQTAQPEDVGSGVIGWANKCEPRPRSDLLEMKNPTCDLRTYTGGQIACHHMFSLLDADQEIPWADRPLEYQLKFRFWFQEYNSSYHEDVQRTTWGIASPVEYDVPRCGEGVPGCSKQDDGTWIHTITGTFAGGGRLVAAHFHCHAPTCLSISMYRCPKGTKVCNASTGTLLCREEPVYGGTGRVDLPRFDEPGFILQPPCLWGSAEFGLEEPPDTDGERYVLGSVKTSNATYGHHGEMAWQQMLFVRPRAPAVYI